jgi:hypothetical protein
MNHITPWHERPDVIRIDEDKDWTPDSQAIVDKAKSDEIAELRAALAQPAKPTQLLDVIRAYREYVDALPQDLVLPAMPGFDRDWADAVEAKAVEQNNDEVICPNCVHQFRAIPVNVQQLMLDAGLEPPFTEAAAKENP